MKKIMSIVMVVFCITSIVISCNYYPTKEKVYEKIIIQTDSNNINEYRNIEIYNYEKELFKDSEKDIKDIVNKYELTYLYIKGVLSTECRIDIDFLEEIKFQEFLDNGHSTRIFKKVCLEEIENNKLRKDAKRFYEEVELVINKNNNDKFINKLNELNESGKLGYNLRFLNKDYIKHGIFSEVNEELIDYDFIELMYIFKNA